MTNKKEEENPGSNCPKLTFWLIHSYPKIQFQLPDPSLLVVDEPIYQTIDEVKPMLSVKRRSIHIKLASLESVSSSTSSSSSSSLSQNVVQSE